MTDDVDLSDLQPKRDQLFMVPFLGDGFTPGGLWVEYSRGLPPIFGRVLRVHPSCFDFGVSAGDVIVYLKHSYDHVHLDDGREFCVMNVRAVHAVVDGYDEQPAVDERPPSVLESAS